MLTGKELGAAIRQAIALKGVSKTDVARHFGVRAPSIQDWMNRGTIRKDRLPELFAYFSDVAGPGHWGLSRPLGVEQPLASYLSAKRRVVSFDDPIIAEVVAIMKASDPTGRAMALAAVKVALSGYRPPKAKSAS